MAEHRLLWLSELVRPGVTIATSVFHDGIEAIVAKPPSLSTTFGSGFSGSWGEGPSLNRFKAHRVRVRGLALEAHRVRIRGLGFGAGGSKHEGSGLGVHVSGGHLWGEPQIPLNLGPDAVQRIANAVPPLIPLGRRGRSRG